MKNEKVKMDTSLWTLHVRVARDLERDNQTS